MATDCGKNYGGRTLDHRRYGPKIGQQVFHDNCTFSLRSSHKGGTSDIVYQVTYHHGALHSLHPPEATYRHWAAGRRWFSSAWRSQHANDIVSLAYGFHAQFESK